MLTLAAAVLLAGAAAAKAPVKAVVMKGALSATAPSSVIPFDEKSWSIRTSGDGETLSIDGKDVFVLPREAGGCFTFREVRRAEAADRIVALLSCGEGEYRLFIIDPVTLRRVQVTNPGDRIINAAYDLTPDGWYLVFAVTHSGKTRQEAGTQLSDEGVFLYDIEKGEKTLYGPADGRVPPRFSPDGAWLAYALWDAVTGRTSIIVAGGDGVALPPLVSFKGRAARLSWDFAPQVLRVHAPGATAFSWL